MTLIQHVANSYHLRVSPVDGVISFTSTFGPIELLEITPVVLGIYFAKLTTPQLRELMKLGCVIKQRGDEEAVLSLRRHLIDYVLPTLLPKK